jgi:hypothetical protein
MTVFNRDALVSLIQEHNIQINFKLMIFGKWHYILPSASPVFAASELCLRNDKFGHQYEKWNVTVCK